MNNSRAKLKKAIRIELGGSSESVFVFWKSKITVFLSVFGEAKEKRRESDVERRESRELKAESRCLHCALLHSKKSCVAVCLVLYLFYSTLVAFRKERFLFVCTRKKEKG